MSHARFSSAALAAGLRKAAFVRPWQRGDLTPALVHLHFAATSCTIISGDFARQIEVTVDCEADGAFTAVAPLTALSGVVTKTTTGSQIEIVRTDEGVRIVAGRGRTNLVARFIDAPPLKIAPDACRAPMGAIELVTGLSAAAPATTDDSARPYLGGVFVHSTEAGLSFAAQDGARIHVAAQDGARIGDVSYLIPSKSAELIVAAFEDDEVVQVFADERAFWVEGARTRVAVGLMTSQFPSVEAQMASPTNRILMARANELLADIDVVMAVANHRDRDFRLDLASECEVSAFRVGDDGYEAGANGLRARFNGAPLAIGFQFPLVRDALALFGSSEIEWRMAGPEQPTLITSPDNPGVEAMVSPFRLVADHQRIAA